jgi:hypothetical protein
MFNIKSDRCLLPRCFIFTMICLGSLTGCASPARPEKMTPQISALSLQIPKTVTVQVIGGQKTDPAWTSEISNEDFASAVRAALQNCHFFSDVKPGGDADYILEVTLVNVLQPAVGFDMSVTIISDWKLIDRPSDRVVWKRQISSTGTATVGDAFAGVERLRLANEAAARANIGNGIAALAKSPPATSQP